MNEMNKYGVYIKTTASARDLRNHTLYMMKESRSGDVRMIAETVQKNIEKMKFGTVGEMECGDWTVLMK